MASIQSLYLYGALKLKFDFVSVRKGGREGRKEGMKEGCAFLIHGFIFL